jgi:hypothetical protein
VDEEGNDPEEEKLDQTSSSNFENASKRVHIAEQLEVCCLITR